MRLTLLLQTDMMSKIRHAIQFNQFPPFNMQLSWIDLMDRSLSDQTKKYVEKGTLDLRILAVIIRDTIQESDSEAQIDKLLWDKLHDQDLVISLISKYL